MAALKTNRDATGADSSSGNSSESLTDRAYGVLRAAIIRGEFGEGKFLAEAGAREKFKIGHTPFREACNRLIHESLLELMPRRGYFVPQLSLQRVRNLFEARIIVESRAAELAAARATTDQIETMASLLKRRLPTKLNANTVEVLLVANSEFHEFLAVMSQNEEIERIVKGVLDRSARLVYLFKDDRIDFDVHEYHRPIYDAIFKKNGKRARELVIADIQAGQSEFFV
jgi:GntR family transcriptional regulator, rspAB operon transcriptional repressor